MPEKIWERLEKVANGLHWLGRYQEANALSLTVRLMREREIETLEDWEEYVNGKVLT